MSWRVLTSYTRTPADCRSPPSSPSVARHHALSHRLPVMRLSSAIALHHVPNWGRRGRRRRASRFNAARMTAKALFFFVSGVNGGEKGRLLGRFAQMVIAN